MADTFLEKPLMLGFGVAWSLTWMMSSVSWAGSMVRMKAMRRAMMVDVCWPWQFVVIRF